MALISIVVPVYNVEKYLRQCLDSLAKQTLTDIEVICVNDGSTDSSLEIIKEYTERDKRFSVIDKANSGYGHSVNMGIDIAQGEYIGIIESDDFAEPNMLNALYTLAREKELDVCKGSFYYHFSKPPVKDIPYKFPKKFSNGTVLSPTGLDKTEDLVELFSIKPTVWSAIYRADFLRSNNIRFTETPGASYQDVAFTFKVWMCAERVMLTNDCFVHYRQDNEASSVNSRAKVFCVCDEYKEIEGFLESKGVDNGEIYAMKNVIKLDTYLWNYERLTKDLALEFILKASRELRADMESGKCRRDAYKRHKWNWLNLIINDPQAFHEARQREKENEKPAVEGYEQGGVFRRWLRRLKNDGIISTAKAFVRKLRGRMRK